MLRQITTAFVFILLCACGNQGSKESLSTGKDSSTAVNAVKTDSFLVTFDGIKNSKWIIGEEGTGEETDTIIFAKQDTLTYITAGDHKEFYHYKLEKDTLIFFSETEEADTKSSKELNCSTITKLHYQSGYFKYVYFDKKCTGDKDSKRTIVDTLNIKLRRL